MESCTQIVLKNNEFIIKLDNTDLLALVQGKEDAKIQIINPHENSYDSTSLAILKTLVESIGKKL